jgi:hypothetical protein
MGMYLAAILGFCALTTPCVATAVVSAHFPQLGQETQPPPDAAPSGPTQDSPQNAAPASPGTEPAAAPQTEPAPPAPAATPEPQKASPEAAEKKAEAKNSGAKTKTSAKKRRRHRKSSAGASSATPEKKVVRNGGTADPVVQLAPGMSAEQASSQRQSTTQLLAATDANLKQISSRQLNSSQQDSISQIRKYLEQAKAAELAGDVQRAHNLASKALLLSDDLVKH